jgi:plastocyanin
MTMTKRLRFVWLGVPLVAALGASLAAWAVPMVHDVHQYGRAFLLVRLDMQKGDVTRFINDDPFLHQMYVSSGTFSFDSDEQQPGQSIDVTWPVRGTFTVHCHIHPTMGLVVNVK